MLRNLKTTTSTENVPPTNIRLIYPATVPEKPYRPRKLFNMVVGTGLGLLLGISLALGLEIADPTLKTPEDVEVYLETPNLAMIPHIDFPTTNPSEDYPELIMHHEKQTLASEAYRVLRTSILFSSPGHAPQVLLLTSALPSEGKTLTAVNLAIAMAKAKGNILLIDSDLRRPDLHQIFKVPKEPGLTNYLVGEIDDLPVMQTRVPHLSLVCSGTSPPNPSELLGSPRMQDLLSKAKEQFNFIIIDSPPLMSVTDATVLATKVEGVLFVVKVETVSRRVAQVARGSLKDVKAHLLGAVLNNVNLQRDGYYYNYYYRYYSYHSPESGVKGRGTRKSRRKTKQTGSFDWVKNKFNNLKDKFYS
jgi:capsular exopolysaccharide synthesis family protein